jgi:hypothetical protein
VHWTTETSAFIAAQRNILATIIQRFFLRRWSSRRQWRSPCWWRWTSLRWLAPIHKS